jgi:Mg-chelatase subunit ChlD
LDVILVMEMSPGTEQAIGLIRERAFQEDDRAGVIGFIRTAQLLQPLTDDRDKIATALQRSGTRGGVAVGGPDRGQIGMSGTVDLAGALSKACDELSEHGSDRKRAIIVLFAGEDPNLSARLDTLQARLSGDDARLYAVMVQRINALESPGMPRTGASRFPMPSAVITPRLMSELAEESGGRIYKGGWDLKKILQAARKP